MKKLPTVAIIGQTNVGKSSLFNRFVGRQQAIVAREAGTTRDSIATKVSHKKSQFWLIDTAGLKEAEDDFEATIQEQITEATELADLILVVLDNTLHPSPEDKQIAKKALKSKKPVLLVVNKTDLKTTVDSNEYLRLGIKEIFYTSANHNSGIDELKDKIAQLLPEVRIREDSDRLKIALIGRPNVGKSFLFNTLANKQQAMVANVAGTTRDLNRVEVRYKGQTIELIDTAGIRKSGKQEQGIEKFSVLRSLQAIEEADVCLLVIDSQEYGTALDQKLAGIIDEAGKGIIIAVSKSDLLDNKNEDDNKNRIMHRITNRLKFVPYAPLVFTSSVTGKNVTKIFELAQMIMNNRAQQIPTRELNRLLMEVKSRHIPPGLKNTRPKLRYIVQTDTNPPWFVVYGNDLKLLHWSYKRHLINAMRDQYDYTGTPIKFSFRENDKKRDN